MLLLLNKLPIDDFRRFILNLDGLSVVRLSYCCRQLRGYILSDTLLWKQLYYSHFLAGLHVAKELDFLYWCARHQLPSIESHDGPSILLKSLDWHGAYRQRVCTENNWRYGHSKRTVLPLPSTPNEENWTISSQCATAILLKCSKLHSNHSPYFIAGLESTPYSPSTQAAINLAGTPSSATLSTPALVKLNSTRECLASTFVNTIMDDMFIVMVSTYPKLHNTRLEVWRRKTYKLNFAHTLPYGCRLESVSGKWALLLCMEYNADSVFNGQMIIWDLELNRQHIKAIDDPWDGVCIFRATETAVTVYAARLDSDNPELITWTFYEFSSDAEPKQLLQNCFTTEFEFYDYIEPSPLDASRILLQEVDIRNNRKLLIHNVMPDNPSRLELDMVEIPEEHVTAALLSQGSCSKIGDRLLVEKQDRFTYNKAIYWPNALECRHIIGSLCIIYEKQDDDSIRIALADNNLGTRLRYLDSYSSDHLNAFLMTSAVIIDNDKCEVNIIDYGAL